MILNLFRRRPASSPPVGARLPERVRVYAVGDIHGRLDLLDALTARIAADARERPGPADYIVYLGDYVDRGLQSRQVLDRMCAPPPPGFGTVHLRGNHEQAMLDFLDDESTGEAWLQYGGVQTLFSYGVHLRSETPEPDELAEARDRLAAALPRAHLSFLTHLRASITIGDYFFAHAGVRPGVPLDAQEPRDLLWIRDSFLTSTADFGKVVVHGHSISTEPELRPNRIGIDTGAFATGRLTCLVLEEDRHRFLST